MTSALELLMPDANGMLLAKENHTASVPCSKVVGNSSDCRSRINVPPRCRPDNVAAGTHPKRLSAHCVDTVQMLAFLL